MVIKRQKLFFAPLALLANPAVGTALTGGMLVQGGIQMKQSSDQAAEAEEQNREQTRALNRIAKAAKENPQVGQDVLAVKQASDTSSILSTRTFAAPNSKTLNNAIGFAKDLGRFAASKKRAVLSGAVMGGTLAAGGAVVDKMIQKDIKRNNLPFLDNQNQQEQKQYSTESVLNKGQDFVKRGFKATGQEFKNQFKGKIGKIATPLFIVAPAAGYLSEKAQYKDQLASTGQRQYSKVPNSLLKNSSKWFKGKGETIKEGWGKFKTGFNEWKNAPVKNSMNAVGGVLGQRGDRMAEQFVDLGNKSGNAWTKKTGEFLTKHGKTAAAGGLAVGMGIMSAGWGQGEKLTKKAIKSVDPNAYAYQESKEGAAV